MRDFKEVPESLQSENRIEYHFNYENFTELFADIRKALINIIK